MDTGYHKNIKYLFDNIKKTHFCSQTITFFIAQLDGINCEKGYSYFDDNVFKIWADIEKAGGDKELANFNKCVLLRLLEDFSERIKSSQDKYPSSIIEQFHINFQRILSEIDLFDDSYFTRSNDLFLKDLGICRLKLIPVGPRVIESHAGYSRKIIISGGVKQFFRFLYFYIFIERKSKYFYQTHVHLSLIKNFNSREIHKSYLRIAELLKMNATAKGLLGASWYYDPALVNISPHLTYLRKQQEDNGAWIFYTEPETSGNPFSKSKTRKKLFEEGKYQPKIYLCIWPKKSILAYSENNK